MKQQNRLKTSFLLVHSIIICVVIILVTNRHVNCKHLIAYFPFKEEPFLPSKNRFKTKIINFLVLMNLAAAKTFSNYI